MTDCNNYSCRFTSRRVESSLMRRRLPVITDCIVFIPVFVLTVHHGLSPSPRCPNSALTWTTEDDAEMQAKQRYVLVFICCAFLAYCYFGANKILPHPVREPQHLPSFHGHLHNGSLLDFELAQLADHDYEKATVRRNCRMESCFDFSRCQRDFRVYVYPLEPSLTGSTPPLSPNYQKIITAIKESRYYTPEPDRACLFVLGIDTLDRDSLSEDYVRNVPSRLQRLPHWNNGRNHLIFNLYSGTWPDYVEESLDFDAGEAILAKASMSEQHLRPGFDVSIPLFHKQFPLRAGSTGYVTSNNFPSNKNYLLAFKGKR